MNYIPKVTILMTVLDGNVQHLEESLLSMLNQTFTDFEFLIIVEYGTNQEIINKLEEHKEQDNRLRIIYNKTKLGFVDSLNLGMDLAKGEYIARMDDDDISVLTRLEKQVKYMDENHEIAVLGSSQIIVTPYSSFPSLKPEHHNDIRAMMVFGYNVTHPTLMLRKKVFDDNNFRYKNGYIAEDQEFWLRIIDKVKFANLPEILLYHRAGYGSISEDRRELLHKEGRRFAQKQLEKLEVFIDIDNPILQGSRTELYLKNNKTRDQFIKESKILLEHIKNQNHLLKIFDEKSFDDFIKEKEKWLKTTKDKTVREKKERGKLEKKYRKVRKWFLDRVVKFKVPYVKLSNQMSLTASNIHKRFDSLSNQFSVTSGNMYKKRLNPITDKLNFLDKQLIDLRYEQNKNKFNSNNKIKIDYLFQFPSFYTSTKSIVNNLVDNKNVEFNILLGEFEGISEIEQTKFAREYLEVNSLKYNEFNYIDFISSKPDILILQSPYDNWHRPKYLSSDKLKSLGIKLVYIPYGIEISDEKQSQDLHFQVGVPKHAWNIYTFSELLVKDYIKYGNKTPAEVSSLGLPKFDSLYHIVNKNIQDENILKQANGRKIVLWKLHFPYIKSKSNQIATPNLQVYLDFAENIKKMQNVYFVIMLHPKFKEMAYKHKLYKANFIMDTLSCYDNVYMHEEADYQIALNTANCLIMDRSAVLVEAIATKKPILYMYNEISEEKLTQSVKDIVSVYYQGTKTEDMLNFINKSLQGEDPMKELRIAMLDSIPYYDGNAGNRIVEDLINKYKKGI